MKIEDILSATGGRVIHGRPDGIRGVSIDSRTIKEGELFIAIKGARFDGHNFLGEAMIKGSGAIVSIPPASVARGKTIIHVNNTIKALQDIAHYLRKKKGIPVIGITGSNGKTTTKELIASILSTKYRVIKNTGNLNNQIGLPLSLVKLGEEDEVAVLEMGASAQGDIRELCSIAEPDYAVITNIGRAHLEGFGSIDVIRKTKLEILDTVKTAVVNADDGFLMEGIGAFKGRVVAYGTERTADVYAEDISMGERASEFTLSIRESGSIRARLAVPGRFNVYNALAASAAGWVVGVGLEDIKQGIEAFQGVPMRYEIKELKGAVVISDVYNANPASMEEALKELVRMKKGRAIAVLGDMLELGSYAEEAHRGLGRWMSKLPIEVFIAVGPLMTKAAEEFSKGSGQSLRTDDAREARQMLLERCSEGDIVLIKGSRGMKMEGVMDNAL